VLARLVVTFFDVDVESAQSLRRSMVDTSTAPN
jgi:hypothetical protein